MAALYSRFLLVFQVKYQTNNQRKLLSNIDVENIDQLDKITSFLRRSSPLSLFVAHCCLFDMGMIWAMGMVWYDCHAKE